jgi:hypothetical protein
MSDTLTLVDPPSFFGAIGTSGAAWATDERPKSFRQKILQLNPNGMMPLTGITSVTRNEPVDDPEYSWWEKQLPLQGGTCDVYMDDLLSDAYNNEAVLAGAIVYAKVTSTVVGHFRVGHEVRLTSGYSATKAKIGKVVATRTNGTSSWVAVKMISADPSNHLATADYIGVIGNINPEGSARPNFVGYKPTKKYNYTQIFRNPYRITRTARKTKLRTRDSLQSLRQEQLMLHGLDIERALLWGERSETTEGTESGEPERTFRGIIPWIQNDASQNCFSFYDDVGDFAGKAWADAGVDAIEQQLEHLFQYGSQEKLCVCGTGLLRGINQVARLWGTNNTTTGQTSFGLKVTRWETPYGAIYFKTHPLFARNETDRWSGVFLEPQNLVMRVLTDTMLVNQNGEPIIGDDGYDGTLEEYIAELGLELHFPETFAYWTGIGLNNATYTP